MFAVKIVLQNRDYTKSKCLSLPLNLKALALNENEFVFVKTPFLNSTFNEINVT